MIFRQKMHVQKRCLRKKRDQILPARKNQSNYEQKYPVMKSLKVILTRIPVQEFMKTQKISFKPTEMESNENKICSTSIEKIVIEQHNTSSKSTEKKMVENHVNSSNRKKKGQLVRMHQFKENEIVWCKMRGFPNWPARVSLRIAIILSSQKRNIKHFNVTICEFSDSEHYR